MNKKFITLSRSFDFSAVPRNKWFGSRRLTTIYKRNTDLDIYLHIKELDLLGLNFFSFKTCFIKTNKKMEYISSKPKYGDVYLAKNFAFNKYQSEMTMDVLIFTDKRDIEIMDKALITLENIKELLSDKDIRISCYNYMLQLYGFIPNNNSSMIIGTNKLCELAINNSLIKEEFLYF